MTKSNIRAVRRRRTNERIAKTYDKVRQEKVRAYQQRNIDRREARLEKRGRSFFKKATDWIRGVFGRFFRQLFRPTVYSSMRSLDMRDGGLFGHGVKRDAGAQQLRSWFPGLGSMVSTRDGKQV